LLFALAAYVVVSAGWGLWSRDGAEFSVPGLAVSLLALPVMRYLARRKIALADRLGSRAMRADALESITCGWLSWLSPSLRKLRSAHGGLTRLALWRLSGSSSRKAGKRGRVKSAPAATS